MIIVYLDSSKNLSVALIDKNKIVDSIYLQTKQASEEILNCIANLMQKNSVEKFKHVVVNIGPGSFVGTRVAIVTALGIRAALQIPIVTVSNLEILACGVDLQNFYTIYHSHQDDFFVQKWIDGVGEKIDLKNICEVEKILQTEKVIGNVEEYLIHKKNLLASSLDLKKTILLANQKINQQSYAQKIEAIQISYRNMP